jgi:hypothetical protein
MMSRERPVGSMASILMPPTVWLKGTIGFSP